MIGSRVWRNLIILFYTHLKSNVYLFNIRNFRVESLNDFHIP